MSETILTVVFVLASLLCAFGIGEWLVRRSGRSSGNDGDRSPG